MTKKLLFTGVLIIIFLISSFTIILFYQYQRVDFDPERIRGKTLQGTIFTDRYGRVIRFLPDEEGIRGIWISEREIPGAVKNAFIAAEDRRFFSHPGFDPLAIIRAFLGNIKAGRIVSGASTISQQVIRIAYNEGKKKRSYKDKFLEIIRSIKMEKTLSKKEILEYYLNSVPMGNNLTGIEAASRAYFGISAKNLTISEAALLAALPKAPSIFNPYGKHREKLYERRRWVLRRMKELNMITEAEYQQALQTEPALKKLHFANSAPHLIDHLLSRKIPEGRIKTTIDLDIQQRVQEIIRSHAQRLRTKGAYQAAAMVVHNENMEVLALVGSVDYSEINDGFNNGVFALNSAGSTLKPFLYALAIESGVTGIPIEDTERIYPAPKGQYMPQNYDKKQYGPVTIRTALGNSLNLSAVRMLQYVGTERFYEMLRDMKLINHPEHGPEYYGLGMAIGNIEVSLEQLVTAYAMLANQGRLKSLRYLLHENGTDKKGKQILLPQTAYIITDILSDPNARILTFRGTLNLPFPVALKTGTSTYFRDMWSIGYTSDYTVGVWVGNFNDKPTERLSGATASAPIMAEIFEYLYRTSTPAPFKRPKGVKEVEVCGYSGMKPSGYCPHKVRELFIEGTEPLETCTFHVNHKDYHELKANYAGWLYTKHRIASAGRYRLRGFDEDLGNVFHDPWETVQPKTVSIRIRNINQTTEKTIKKEDIPEKKRYTIGNQEILSNQAIIDKGSVQIVYPLDGDRFVINRHNQEQNWIRLQAVSEESLPYIDWFINGEFYVRTGPPYETYWAPEQGIYRITAVTPINRADSIRIVVE